MEIQGRRALVTGASGGIGAAIAEKLARLHVDVALHYASNETGARALAERLSSMGVQTSIHQAHLESADECKRLAREVGKIDILILNAGVARKVRQIWDISDEDFEITQAVNVRAPFLLCRELIPHMRDQRWGRIVSIGSIAAYGGGINGSHYAASKGGILGMIRNLSTRLAEYNITANDVAPALIGGTGIIPNESSIGDTSIPLGRLGRVEEVADVVEMFVKNGFTTGQSLIIGGGLK